ncbi:LysR family transcriptional regulator [Bdellovibrio sp. HCB117]|uniref:LysR family transcriptional regulator n=1 Tax=Bdellovibrio sp. HCB117 TaxID=3394359 RepID=UPI0039B4BEA8
MEIFISIMEIFELRYFIAVAQTENVNRAAEAINVSAGSLSKAISRLEDELQTPLFFKTGRGIKLTPEGLVLKKKAAQILQLEEDAKLELRGKESGSLNVFISSEEILQSYFGIEIVQKISKIYPQAKIQFLIRSDESAIEQVKNGEAHLALITSESPIELSSKLIAKVEFKTTASKVHPLYKKYGSQKAIPPEELLQHSFVSPDSAVLGKITKSDSIDGWRDDKFPRKIRYKVCGLKLMENLVGTGAALAYLPDYFVKSADLEVLKVPGYPYSCHQNVRLITKDPSALGWLNKLWDQL